MEAITGQPVEVGVEINENAEVVHVVVLVNDEDAAEVVVDTVSQCIN